MDKGEYYSILPGHGLSDSVIVSIGREHAIYSTLKIFEKIKFIIYSIEITIYDEFTIENVIPDSSNTSDILDSTSTSELDQINLKISV